MECAEHLNDGCALIRNKYLEAAKADDEDAMYSLFVDQMAVNEKPVPFIVRAIAGLRNEGLWRTFAQAVADELEFLLQAEIEEELNGLLEEDEDYVGMLVVLVSWEKRAICLSPPPATLAPKLTPC